MTRLAAIITFISFLSVTTMEHSVYLICTITGCEWSQISATVECETYDCSGCCCADAVCTPPVAETEYEFSCRLIIPIDIALDKSCECPTQPPHQLATREENRNLSTKYPVERCPENLDNTFYAEIKSDLNQSRPCGVNLTVPTTVLRI